MSYRTLRTERQDDVLVVHLDRPGRLNAITFEMFAEFAALQREVAASDVRAVILTGSGRAFCAGLDLDQAATLPDMGAIEMLHGQRSWSRAIAGFHELDVPVIAAINGAAAGAGMSLALMADIRIAVADARFNAAFVRIGLSGGDCGTSWALPRLIGLAHATEILLTGRFVTAPEALELGLVTDVVADDQLLPRALEIATAIAANSPVGVALTKQALRVNVDAPSLEAALDLEDRNQVLATRTHDMPEALAAFREGRAPDFNGR